MVYKWSIFVLLTSFVGWIYSPSQVSAKEPHWESLDHRQVLIIYNGWDEQSKVNVQFLDSTLSGLFKEVTMVSIDEFQENNLAKKDIVFFYSAIDTKQNLKKLEPLKEFKGEFVGIGIGAIDLPQFKDWMILGKTTVRKIDTINLTEPLLINHINKQDNMKVLLYGEQFDERYPIILNDGKTSYIAINDLYSELKYVFSSSLFDLLQIEKPSKHLAYIRLEDISPASNPGNVRQAANFLLEKGIPVYLTITPTYVNQQTGEVTTLKDAPKLTKVIKELVEKGAYIIAHGYEHSYRFSEEGEGIEFWDFEYNQPITSLDANDEIVKMQSEDQFSNNKEYEKHINTIKTVEKEYVENKLVDAIHLFTDLKTPPIAFEAPNYAMSSNGYKVASNHFSALVGQLQASDQNGDLMISPLFISRPSILNGMTLYPETIGYFNNELKHPIDNMKEKIDEVIQVPGSVIGGYYHPFLGMDYLIEMVELIESTSNIEWLEIKNDEHITKTKFVQATFLSDGEIRIESKITRKDRLIKYFKENPIELSLWLIGIITTIFVAIFSVNIVRLRVKYRKRLFEERD